MWVLHCVMVITVTVSLIWTPLKFVPPGTKLPEKYEPTHKISFLRCILVHCQWTNVTLCSPKVISRHHDKNESL